MVVVLVYASQTGTAEEVSQQLHIGLRKRGLEVYRTSAADVDLKMIIGWQQPSCLVLFLVSTTGDGEPPNSLVKLWSDLLDVSLPANSFQRLNYSLFGFGDSKYGDQYNAMARKLDRRLTMLGAKKVYERGLGDQQDQPLGYRLEYEQWRNGLMAYLEQRNFKGKPDISIGKGQFRRNSLRNVKVSGISSLVASRFGRQTFEVTLNCNCEYNPGDIISIRPSNELDTVDYFLKYFELAGDQTLCHHELQPMSARQLFTDYLNLTDTVPFSFWASIERCITSPQNKEQAMLNDKLIQFSSDFTEYKSYIKDSRRNLREVLEDFPLLHLSLEYLLEHINLLRFREYSIASAFNGSTVRLLVRLVEKELTPYRTIKGLLSNEITQQSNIGKPKMAVVSQGKLTYQAALKYILVGIGTGVAPLLSIVRQRSLEKPWNDPSIVLYFGNQTQKEIYYKDELVQLQKNNVIRFRPAVSRETPKQHVQDLIRSDQEFLRSFANDQTCVYICGTSHTFARSIATILVEGILHQSEKAWKKEGRLIQEFW